MTAPLRRALLSMMEMAAVPVARRWQGPTRRVPAGERFVRFLSERQNGPMAMGAASLDPRHMTLPFDMGLAALGGGAGILALNRLALTDLAAAPEQRSTDRLLRERLAELRRGFRDQGAREWGYMTGLEVANDDLARDVGAMNTVAYGDSLTEPPPDRLYPPRRQHASAR